MNHLIFTGYGLSTLVGWFWSVVRNDEASAQDHVLAQGEEVICGCLCLQLMKLLLSKVHNTPWFGRQ